MRIVFLGTPEFAVPSLQALHHSRHDVLAVVTAPDSLGGRGGNQLIQSEVKKYALANDLPVLQPEKLKSKQFISQILELNADIHVVVAFRMLPEVIWNMPRLGTINLHGSLLPKYRGAAPIHWAVIHGEKTTGVTIFRLKHEIDTGDIIKQTAIAIGPDETTGDVYYKLMVVGAKALIESMDELESDQIQLIPQVDQLASDAPKLFHHQGQIDFTKSTKEIHDFIRGYSPFPTAWMLFHEIKYLFYRSHIPDIFPPWSVAGDLQILGHKLYLHTRDGSIEILEIQQEGKKRMLSSDFINGMKNHSSFK